MRIILLEDNHFQAEFIIDGLRRAYGLKESDYIHIKTEWDFRTRLSDIVAFKPDIAVLDVMVLWRYPEPDVPHGMPDDVRIAGYHTAGIRCAYLLREQLAEIPIVFYTIVDSDELRRKIDQQEKPLTHILFVNKGPDQGEIVRSIRSAIREVRR